MQYYRLDQNVENYVSLIWDDSQTNGSYEEDFIIQLGLRKGQPLENNYITQNFLILGCEDKNDVDNTKFSLPMPDFSTSTAPFYLISMNVYTLLSDIFSISGEIFPVNINGKSDLYYGFYPTLILDNVVDLEKSDINEWGFIQRKHVLISSQIKDYHIFCVKESFKLYISQFVKESLIEMKAEAIVFIDVELV